MKPNQVPSEFDWVNARAACSTFQMFKKLQMGATSDAEARNAQIDRKKHDLRFSVVPGRGQAFAVIREEFVDLGNAVRSSVDFVCHGNVIRVSEQDKEILSVEVTLNDAGRCTCNFQDEELEEWQVRRRVLESLLFQFPAIP